MTTLIPPARSYADERRRFLTDVEQLGALIEHHPHPLLGPDGDELSTDVARLGAPIGEADVVVILSSGVHGVEGHAGSGLQHLLCRSGRASRLPGRTALVLVHSLNPFGHAWSRRVDHTNVDVNRNFLPDYDRLPHNERYAEVDHLLNPTDTEFDLEDTTFLVELAAWIERTGAAEGFQTISGGQYSHPAGVQFGGQQATWSRSTIERIWDRHLEGARRVIGLDVHTGLGPMGRLTVFQTADGHDDAADLGRRLYPDHVFRADRAGGVDHGLLGPGLDAFVAGRFESSTFVVEFGTHDPAQGASVFRADNWLHNVGDPSSAVGDAIRAAMLDFFYVDDTEWRRAVAEEGIAAIEAALDEVDHLL